MTEAPGLDGVGAALAVLDGTKPTGTWRLFVHKDETANSGSIADWSLQITHDFSRVPVAHADAYRAVAGKALRCAAPGVLANDADPDGGSLTARLVVLPRKGALTLSPDGSFAYKPRRWARGIDSFTYEVTDAQGFTAQAKVTITIKPARRR